MKSSLYLAILLSFCLSAEAAAPAIPWKKGLALVGALLGARTVYNAYQNHKLLKREKESAANQSIMPACSDNEWEKIATLNTDNTLGWFTKQNKMTVANMLFSPNSTLLTAILADGSTLTWSIPSGTLVQESRKGRGIYRIPTGGYHLKRTTIYSPNNTYMATVENYNFNKHLQNKNNPDFYNISLQKPVELDLLPHYIAGLDAVTHNEGQTIVLSKNNRKPLSNTLQPAQPHKK